MDQKEKGDKILKDPKAPKFLHSHMDKLNALWADANKCAESRLKQLKGLFLCRLVKSYFCIFFVLLCTYLLSCAQEDKMICDYQF